MSDLILKFKKHFKKILIIISIIGVVFIAKMITQKPKLIPQPVSQPIGVITPPEESLFAEIDKNNTVIRVIVASQEFIDTGKLGNPNNWIKTSIKGTIRKNYAGIGYTYDKTRDGFIPPKPITTATLDETKLQWIIPIVIPTTSTIITATTTK